MLSKDIIWFFGRFLILLDANSVIYRRLHARCCCLSSCYYFMSAFIGIPVVHHPGCHSSTDIFLIIWCGSGQSCTWKDQGYQYLNILAVGDSTVILTNIYTPYCTNDKHFITLDVSRCVPYYLVSALTVLSLEGSTMSFPDKSVRLVQLRMASLLTCDTHTEGRWCELHEIQSPSFILPYFITVLKKKFQDIHILWIT